MPNMPPKKIASDLKVDGDIIVVKNIMGQEKQFKGYKIVEIDVPNTRLVLFAL